MNELATALRGSVRVAALALVILMTCLTGSASAALVGLERVAPASATNSSAKGVTATCPAGKQVLGAGGDTTPGDGDVLLDDIRPSADLKSVTVNAVEDETGTAATWFVQTFAICAYPPPGLQRVAATSALDSANKSVTASCPAGKRLLGTGAEINAANRQVLFDDITPNSGLTAVTAKAVEDQTGNPANWSLTAYAICANPVAGLQRVSLQSAVDSSEPKVIEAPCPAGKQVIGTAGNVNSSNGQVVLDAVFPDPALTSAGLAAFEDDTGNSANWSLTAVAICAASARRVVTSSATDSSDKVAVAGCPAGTQATGGGYDITGGLGQVLPDQVGPLFGPAAIWTRAQEDENGFAGNWSLHAYAICATPLAGVEVVVADSPFDSFSKWETAQCPPGKRVVGAGGEIINGSGEVTITEITPFPSSPTSVQVRGGEDDNGFAGDWSVIAYATCANPLPGLQLVTARSPFDSDEIARVTATCPAGKYLVGAGGDQGSVAAVAVMDDLRPDAALTSVTVTAVEQETGYAPTWSAGAHAICANI